MAKMPLFWNFDLANNGSSESKVGLIFLFFSKEYHSHLGIMVFRVHPIPIAIHRFGQNCSINVTLFNRTLIRSQQLDIPLLASLLPTLKIFLFSLTDALKNFKVKLTPFSK